MTNPLIRFAPQLALAPSSAALHNALATSRVGAVQSYATIYGHAINVRFAGGSESGSRLLPLWNPLAIGACESTVLETWFNKLAQPRFGMHKKTYGVPLRDVEQQIGVLNTAYHTAFPALDHARTVPFAGSAEFTRLPHRQELNISVTLWDERRRPLSTTTFTGPKGNEGGGALGLQITNAEMEKQLRTMRRAPMAVDAAAIPSSENDTAASSSEHSQHHPPHHHHLFGLPDDADREMMISLPSIDFATFRELKHGGFVVAVASSPTPDTAKITDGSGKDSDSSDTDALLLPLSAATHDAAVTLFASEIWARTQQSGGCCRLVAKTATLGTVVPTRAFELRSAPPLFTPRLFSRPWDHDACRTGLPNLRGQPCLALRIETVQGADLAGVGTYFFTACE